MRGKHGRQPSPTQLPTPQQTPSQAEVKSNLFNVFSSSLDNTPPPSPTKPTGKFARRKQQLPSPPASPMPTKAIPVPQPNIANNRNMAYSDPFPLARPLAHRPFAQQDFRLVDDTDHDSILITPRRPNPAFSMPLPRSSFGKHRRTSSDIFPMSDEDASTSSSGSDFHTTLFKNYHLNKSSSASTTTPPRSRQSSPFSGMSSTEARLEREANEKAGYFASSIFQNSPSPEELPDPMLL